MGFSGLDGMHNMRRLINTLNDATEKYDNGKPIMTDKEWDNLYWELVALEHLTNTIYPDSPTQHISYRVVDNLTKVEHNHKMLSLDKTKNVEDIVKFLGDKEYVAMAKLDGLTCSLRYVNGYLISAETRGNGIIGEDILHNISILPNVPIYIDCEEEIVVDGEIICTYDNFAPFAEQYKNPRNFAAGSIRLLNASECALRNLSFVAWDLVKGFNNLNNFTWRLKHLVELGFTVVPWVQESITYAIDELKEYCNEISFPIDGIVFKFEDVAYGKSLGETAHHFKNAIAYKFYDEEYETELTNIEWSMGRTGVLTPVAIFNSVDMDGSIVERASLHNISVMKELLGNPYVGQKIWVVKQNMIIPQITRAELDSEGKHLLVIPDICPVCGGTTEIRKDNDSEVLYCTNNDCEGKLINKLDHFCGKKGLDIKGLSKATLNKLMDWNWVNNYIDIFNLSNYRNEWVHKDGFGQKSVDNILTSIENSKTCSLDAFIAALGIPLIGRVVATDLCKYFKSFNEFIYAIQTKFNFETLPGFADSKANALLTFDYKEAIQLAKILTITNVQPVEQSNSFIKDKKFVITGLLNHFKNRTELENYIAAAGGKCVSAVSKNVDYLINNDITSTSSKNLTAKKLNIPIITEEQFCQMSTNS